MPGGRRWLTLQLALLMGSWLVPSPSRGGMAGFVRRERLAPLQLAPEAVAPPRQRVSLAPRQLASEAVAPLRQKVSLALPRQRRRSAQANQLKCHP